MGQAEIQDDGRTDGKPADGEVSGASGGELQESGERGANVVGEARRYRKRAQSAERSVQELKDELAAREKVIAERESRIAQQEKAIAAMERRQLIDDALVEAEAIDLEAARVLAQAQLAEMDEGDVDTAIGELKRRRPYLFRSRPQRRSGGTLSPKVAGEGVTHANVVEHAADQAVTTGKRGDLLRYLRLRRKR